MKKLLLVFLSLALTLAALDIGFRIHPPPPLQVNDPYKYTQMIGGLKAGVPLASYIEIYPLQFDLRGYYAKSEGGIFYFMDQFGGRWKEASTRRLGKNVDIFVGDSLTYGFGLRYEDTFAYRYGAETGADVVNLAQPGFNSCQALEIYEKWGAKVPHRTLIYGLHLNDLIAFPTSYVATNEKLGVWAARSPFFGFVLQKWDIAFLQPKRVREIVSAANGEAPYFRENFAAILRMADSAKGNHAAFHVALLPVLAQLREDTFRPAYDRIGDALRKNGISVIDLTRDLSTYREQDLWITPFDQHPNEVANGIFAEKLKAAIAGKP